MHGDQHEKLDLPPEIWVNVLEHVGPFILSSKYFDITANSTDNLQLSTYSQWSLME